MDGEPKAAQEGSLLEANFLVGKGTGFLTFLRETNPGLLRKLEPIPKSMESVLVQGALFLEGIERPGRGWNEWTRR